MKVDSKKHQAVKRLLEKMTSNLKHSRCLYLTLFNCRSKKVKQIISLILICKGVYDMTEQNKDQQQQMRKKQSRKLKKAKAKRNR